MAKKNKKLKKIIDRFVKDTLKEIDNPTDYDEFLDCMLGSLSGFVSAAGRYQHMLNIPQEESVAIIQIVPKEALERMEEEFKQMDRKIN